VLHRYDPRTKIILLLACLIIFFLPLPVEYLSVYLAALVTLSVSFLGLSNTWRPLRLILPILGLVLVLTPPFHRHGPALITIRNLPILTVPGLLLALRLIVRFSGITLSFYLFVGTTDPDSLILAFRWFRIPFILTMVLSIALEYIPAILLIYNQVRDAHKLRLAGEQDRPAGVDRRDPIRTSRGARTKRMRRGIAELIPVLTSVIIQSVRRIPTLAMALECRGVGLKSSRTSFQMLKRGLPLLGDGLIAVLVLGLLAVSVVLFP
jgi:energy-coupling factor transporter transmembrane protein EcfT